MKKTKLPPVCLFLLLMAATSVLKGQSLSSSQIKDQMGKDWERAKAYTTEYLNKMPSDKYNFQAADSVRSFAQQMLHLAAVNVFLMTTATGAPAPAWMSQGMENRPSAQSKDSVMYFVMASYDFCRDAAQRMDEAKWGETIKVFNTYDATRFALLNKAFEHQTHHRGQTTIYLRQVGVKPPQERLF